MPVSGVRPKSVSPFQNRPGRRFLLPVQSVENALNPHLLRFSEDAAGVFQKRIKMRK